MDFISLSSSRSRDSSMVHHVFRRDERQMDSQVSRNRHPFLLSQRSMNYGRDDVDEYDIPIIEKLSLSQSSADFNNGRHCFISDSREPVECEDRIQSYTSCRSNDDGERTASSSPSEVNTLNILKRTSNDEEACPHDLCLGSSLKRANPVYESESESEEHIEFNRLHVKRRRSIVLDKHHSATPLFWTERLSAEWTHRSTEILSLHIIFEYYLSKNLIMMDRNNFMGVDYVILNWK